jgi:maleylacetate reductase
MADQPCFRLDYTFVHGARETGSTGVSTRLRLFHQPGPYRLRRRQERTPSATGSTSIGCPPCPRAGDAAPEGGCRERWPKNSGRRVRLGFFAGAVMHTPVDVTEQAMDVVRQHERGLRSSRLAAARRPGSARRSPAHRPAADRRADHLCRLGGDQHPRPDRKRAQDDGARRQHPARSGDLRSELLTLGLPVGMTVTSALNAMAHAWRRSTPGPQPGFDADGHRGPGRLPRACRFVVGRAPTTAKPGPEALYGAWLCGTVLGRSAWRCTTSSATRSAARSILPHAETHAIILPHTIAFNARAAVPDLLAPVARIFGGGNPGGGLWDFAKAARGAACAQGPRPFRRRSRPRRRLPRKALTRTRSADRRKSIRAPARRRPGRAEPPQF